MADHIIKPTTAIVKCCACKTLYVPDRTKDSHWLNGGFMFFEPCPYCGSDANDMNDRISLWKYNLIKWWRSKIE